MGNAFQHFGLQRQRCVATGTAQRNGDARRSALGRTVGNHSPLGMEQGAGHRPAAMAPVKAQVWVTLRWLEPRLLLLQINVMSDAEPPSGTLSIVSSTNGPVAGVGPQADFRTDDRAATVASRDTAALPSASRRSPSLVFVSAQPGEPAGLHRLHRELRGERARAHGLLRVVAG